MGPVENDATRNAGERIRDIKKSSASLDDGKRLDRIACVYGRRYGRRGTSSEQGGVRRGGKTDISKLQGGSRKPRKQMGRARVRARAKIFRVSSVGKEPRKESEELGNTGIV